MAREIHVESPLKEAAGKKEACAPVGDDHDEAEPMAVRQCGKMTPIKITQHDRVIAEEEISSLNFHDEAMWKIRVPRPRPGFAFWSRRGGRIIRLLILGVANDWLIVRLPNGRLGAIHWRDGWYHATFLRNTFGQYVTHVSRMLLVDDGGQVFNKSNTIDVTCNNTGYRGRVGLFEVLEMTDELRALIEGRASLADLRRKAEEQGMMTLSRSGLIKIAAGLTTLEEVVLQTLA